MKWNIRVVNCPSENGGEDWLEFKEVFYNDKRELLAYSDVCIGSELVNDLHGILKWMKDALEKPVLHEKDFQDESTQTQT